MVLSACGGCGGVAVGRRCGVEWGPIFLFLLARGGEQNMGCQTQGSRHAGRCPCYFLHHPALEPTGLILDSGSVKVHDAFSKGRRAAVVGK